MAADVAEVVLLSSRMTTQGETVSSAVPGWHGYADAKPSEAIQKHELPELCVAVVFPYKPGIELIEPPVQQYKDYSVKTKGKRARRLAKWLDNQREEGLLLSGFFQVDSQVNAAKAGLAFIEELSDTRVESHCETWRLFFGQEHLDFAQAVALMYYFLTINFGILRAGTRLDPSNRALFVAMDRFPGKPPKNPVPGAPLPPTQGAKFIDFVRTRSAMGPQIEKENASKGLTARLGSLDWWKRRDETDWRAGKSHPHFSLPDWLAAAAHAHAFPQKYAASLKNRRHGTAAVEGLEELYQAFKRFDLWSATGIVAHLHPSRQLWQVPPKAQDFILARAAG